jgi:hypothetical protein
VAARWRGYVFDNPVKRTSGQSRIVWIGEERVELYDAFTNEFLGEGKRVIYGPNTGPWTDQDTRDIDAAEDTAG